MAKINPYGIGCRDNETMSLSINGYGNTIAWGLTPEAAVAPRPAPQSSTLPAQVSSPVPAATFSPATRHLATTLQRTGERLDAASGAVIQIKSLLQSVEQSLAKSSENPADLNAGTRILQSAATTAEDVVTNAKANGTPVFILTTAAPMPLRNVVGAYGIRQTSLQTGGVADPPHSTNAINSAREALSGHEGVVPTLDLMAKVGPQEGLGAQAKLADMSAKLSAALGQIDMAKKIEVNQPLAILAGTTAGSQVPFDLKT